jgi:hypothetical protein
MTKEKETDMPMAEIEILRTVEITRDESAILQLDVPQHILDDPDELYDWVEEEMNKPDSEVRQAVDAVWETTDENESIEYNEVNNLDD